MLASVALAGCGDSLLPWESVASLAGERGEGLFQDVMGCLPETACVLESGFSEV